MSPEEIALLQNAGEVIIFNISATVIQSVLYGLYLVIFAFGIRALLCVVYSNHGVKILIELRKRSSRTKSTWILLGLLFTIFVISTASLAIGVTYGIDQIRTELIQNTDKTFIKRLRLADLSTNKLNVALNWLDSSGGGGGFLFLFADAVVVWRAYVLWPGNMVAKVFLLALLFASLVATIASGIINSIPLISLETTPTSSLMGTIYILTQALSLATNFVATMLIGYKAYNHRQVMQASLGLRGSKPGMILLFLTESGVVFCILQIVAIATSTADNTVLSTIDYAVQIWQQLMFFSAATYPVLVLLVIDSYRSISDHTGGSAGDSGVAQGSNAGSLGVEPEISFAPRQRGISSSGGGVGEDSMTGSHIDPTAIPDRSNEVSV